MHENPFQIPSRSSKHLFHIFLLRLFFRGYIGISALGKKKYSITHRKRNEDSESRSLSALFFFYLTSSLVIDLIF